MTKHDFIFSDQRRYRLARHIAFWLVWSLAYNILFHLPTHVFRGWDPNSTNKMLQQLGFPLFFIKTLIVNSFLGTVVPQIALTYVLIYWLLPNYYFKRKNLFLAGSITVSVLIIFYFVAAGSKYFSVISNHISGIKDRPDLLDWSFKLNLGPAVRDQLSSLPIVLGFALMIKFVKRWWQKQKETDLLAKEKTKAELQLLKAQVHPHFLFNTLNNIYFFTLTNSTQAPVMIKKLSGMLHYILNECDQPLVPLEKEIKMIQDYMALEKIRYGEQMQMTIDIPDNSPPLSGATEGWERSSGRGMIAPLLLIPFVENSFKHGASKMITQPWVKLYIYIENNRLHFTIRNSKPLSCEPVTAKGKIGLKNVRKRLELLYPGTHELNIVSEPGIFAVYLNLQLHDTKEHTTIEDEIKPLNEYAMA